MPAYLIEVCGRRAGAADVAGDEDGVGAGFRDARRDRADAGLRDELHADARDRVDLLQVVDELREIFDRVDVVVRRRADERDAGRRVAQARDQFGDFEAGQLAAFARLGALRDFDFDFAALVQIFGRDAEAAGGDLLHGGVGVVAVRERLVALGVFAAFAADAARADAVHGDVERAVRFGRERAHAHAGRDEALADVVDAFDLGDRRRVELLFADFEQIAELDRLIEPAFADDFGVFAVGFVVAGVAGVLELVDRVALRARGVRRWRDSDRGRRAGVRSAFRRSARACWSAASKAMPPRPMPEMRLVRPGKNSSTSARERPMASKFSPPR